MESPQAQKSPEPRQRLAGNGGAALAGMVDQEDGGVEGACQLTQCGENGGDLAGVIFIGALEAYERIKDQQLGALAGERKVEPVQVLGTVKTEPGVEDEPDIECGEVGAARVRDALDATLDLMRRVFSREDEHRPGTGDREAAQARTTGGDRDRQLQRQKCLGCGSFRTTSTFIAVHELAKVGHASGCRSGWPMPCERP